MLYLYLPVRYAIQFLQVQFGIYLPVQTSIVSEPYRYLPVPVMTIVQVKLKAIDTAPHHREWGVPMFGAVP
jgi:hypothetical protein